VPEFYAPKILDFPYRNVFQNDPLFRNSKVNRKQHLEQWQTVIYRCIL